MQYNIAKSVNIAGYNFFANDAKIPGQVRVRHLSDKSGQLMPRPEAEAKFRELKAQGHRHSVSDHKFVAAQYIKGNGPAAWGLDWRDLH